MINKLTEEEKNLLIELRIKKIDKYKKYGYDLFKLYYKENPKENYIEWQKLDYEKKVKLMKGIIKQEDKSIVMHAFSRHKLNVKKVMDLIAELKEQQLKEFGIRKNDKRKK